MIRVHPVQAEAMLLAPAIYTPLQVVALREAAATGVHAGVQIEAAAWDAFSLARLAIALTSLAPHFGRAHSATTVWAAATCRVGVLGADAYHTLVRANKAGRFASTTLAPAFVACLIRRAGFEATSAVLPKGE